MSMVHIVYYLTMVHTEAQPKGAVTLVCLNSNRPLMNDFVEEKREGETRDSSITLLISHCPLVCAYKRDKQVLILENSLESCGS